MTKILLPFLLVFSSVFAQVNENIIGNWLLTNITINGETLSPLNQDATATLNFTTQQIQMSYQSEPCVITSANFNENNSFSLDFTVLELTCLSMPNVNPPYEPFQEFYTNFFSADNEQPIPSPSIYNYAILDFDGFTTLSIERDNGDILNAVMYDEDEDFFDTWVLSSITYQNQTLEPSPEVEPATLLFNFVDGQFNLDLDYCNTCSFPIEFISEDEFVVLNNDFCTLLICENEAFQPVLGIYENGFWQNIGAGNPYTFIITADDNISTLTITNSNGDVMIFNINFASNPIHENPTIDLYPNPAHEALFLSSPTVFENYQIFDFSGKIVQKGEISITNAIDVQGLPKGMYFVQLENQNTQITMKFLKE